jgi:hypothetical protein
MIERAIGSINDEMLSIPRFIMSIHYFIPSGLPLTNDIRGAAFRWVGGDGAQPDSCTGK